MSGRGVDGSGAAQDSSDVPKRTTGTSSARRVLQLLLSFSERRPRATVVELSTLLGVPQATTYRYVALLKELQLVEEGPPNQYHLTSTVMPLARAAQMVNDYARLAHPIMEETARNLRETVMLLQPSGNAAVCVERVECDRPMRFTFEPGHTLPLGFGASGKMLLSCLSKAEQNVALRTADTEEQDVLKDGLRLTDQRGYALSSGEIDDGVWACSVPVLKAGRASLVLSLAGPGARISEEERKSALSQLKDSAQAIRARIDSFEL